MYKKIFLILSFYFLISQPSNADYIATGSFEGTECKGFGIKFCSNVKIDAVGEGNKLFEMKREYKRVTEYSSSQNLCHINLKGRGILGFWGNVAKSNMAPNFYTKILIHH